MFLGRAWDDSQQVVPGINLGFNTANDPAASLFNTTAFPGASTGQLGDARALYAMLTGRVGSVTGQATLDPETNKYSFLGRRRRHGKLDNYSTYVQDSWRVTPTLTVNAGVRWDVESGWLRTILGDPEQATIRGGYSVAYERQGFGAFTGVFGPNPGSTLTLTRDANTGLVPAGESWPVLLRETNRLYPAPFPASPVFPIAVRANRADSINAFHPDIKIASARSWTIGFQRAISNNMAVEVRYVGTRGW